MPQNTKTQDAKNRANLKTVAERVGLAPCSVSAVLNDTPASRTIPQTTKDRIFRAASELNYRPNFWARSLRTKRTRMIAVVAGDFGNPAVARVIAAAQERLHRRGYLLVLGTMAKGDSAHFPAYLRQRGIEGLIAIDTAVPEMMDLPVAAVDLSYVPPTGMIGPGLDSWLQDLGISAAEAVVAEIDGMTTAAAPIQPKRPTMHFDVNGITAQP